MGGWNANVMVLVTLILISRNSKHSGKPLLCPSFFYDTEVYSEGFHTTNFI